MKMVFRKVLGHLEPVDDAARTFLAKTKAGREVMVEVHRARNPRFHRWAFSLMQLVVENQERYQTVEHLLNALKCATGHYVEYPSTDGKTRFVVPKSISFESMDNDEFSAWVERAVHVICRDIIPGTDNDALRAEVEARIAGPYAA